MPNIYSRELVELIFFEFYTKNVYIDEGFLISRKIGREKIYLNKKIFEIVKESGYTKRATD